MKFFRSLLTVIILLLPALALAAKPQMMPVSGLVMSAETNRPMAGVQVSFHALNARDEEQSKAAAETVTDSDGRFSVVLPHGGYRWYVQMAGYGHQELYADVNPSNPPQLTTYMRKGAELSGRILDGAGTPMPGVTVAVDRKLSAVSDSGGNFTISALDARGYQLTLKHPGWVLGKAVYFQVTPGERKNTGDLIIRRGGTLLVTMEINGQGKTRAVPKAEMSLSAIGFYSSFKLDKERKATVSNIPPGRFILMVTDERLQEQRQEWEIKEGETVKVSVKAEVRPPTLNIEDYGDVFLPEKPLKLRANGLWVERAEAVVSRIDGRALWSGATDLRKPADIPAPLLKRVSSAPISFKARRGSHTRNASVPVPALPPGAYLLELKGSGAAARFAFLVTRLGLVAKTSARSTLLFATDLSSGAPLPRVNIKALATEAGAVPPPETTSDASGLAAWPGNGKKPRLAARLGDSMAFLELGGEDEARPSPAHKGYIYTDRPAYRPGQSVFFKGVLRQRAGEGYTLPDSPQVHVVVKDSGDKSICESDITISATGSFNGECLLPAVPALGDYTILATLKDESSRGYFQVLAYRKPEFEIKLTPDKPVVVAGDTGRIRLSARYYFGAPIAGGKASWRMYTQPQPSAGRNDEDATDDERFHTGYSDFIGEGEVHLDDNGDAVIPFIAKTHEMPVSYTLEADVADSSSRQVSSSAAVMVAPSLVSLQLKSGAFLTKPGEPVELNVRAATWEGSPLALAGTLSFEREVYDRKLRNSSWQPVDTAAVTTGADGNGQGRFAFPRPGYWRVKGEAADQAGRKSTAYQFVWVWKSGSDWDGSYRELQAEFDRKLYRVGETARLIVRSPVAGGSLLLTLEGRDVLTRRVIPLKSLVEVVELPVTAEYAPVVHVSAVMVAGGRFFSRTLPLKSDHFPGKLDLSIKPDRTVYAPGDRVRLTLSAQDAGKPLPAELSLAVVDEAIFAVARERSDDIYTFFRGTREHLVTTLHSFPRVYLGGASKEAAAFGADDSLKGLTVRKTFKDTAYWLPELVTGQDGSATAEFTLPDNLTTWRATVVGQTAASLFGSGREKFIARLDLMARLSPPRFMTAGDELAIPGMINSMSGAPLQVSGRFAGEGVTLSGDPAFGGLLPPKGTLRRDMTVKAEKAGSATLRLLAKGGEQGDAMELTLPVLERAIPRQNTGGLALREKEGELELTLPPDALTGSARMTVSFAPGIAGSLDSAIGALIDFPYGCVEQTLSRFIPAVHTRALLAKQAWQPDAATSAKLPPVIADSLKRLEEMQHEDGGWGWWKNDATRLTMTSHTLYGLGLGKRVGLDVPQEMQRRGVASLQTQMVTAPLNELPRACRALAVNGLRDDAAEKRITAGWQELSTADQLAFTEALVLGGRGQEAIPLLENLKKEVQSEGSAAYIRDRAAESWWYGWRWGSSAVETTAALLTIVSALDSKAPLAPRLAEFLARRQQGGWWRTTSASAAAVTALADYVAATGENSADYSADLELNGKPLTSFRIAQGKVVSGPARLSIPAADLKNGVNTLRLKKDGNGAAYLNTAIDFNVPPEAAASSPELKLERTLYRISSRKDGTRWLREYTPLKPGEPLAPGDDVEIRLTVENKKSLEYVILEDRLPAGFESREADRDPRFADESGYRGWFSHRERRDEKLAFFITSLPAGRHEFRHVIYPELAGRVMALPAAGWPMYQPEMRGESAAWEFIIKGR